MKLISFLILLTCFPFSSFSQNQMPGGGMPPGGFKAMGEKLKVGHFYGKIIDSTSNKPVEFASVQLIGNLFDTITKQMKKDVVIAGQLTLENGDFSLEKINVMGKYKLKISALGYEIKEMSLFFNIDMDKLKNGGGMSSMMNAVDKDLGNIKIKQQAKELKAVDIVSSAPVLELKLDKKVFNVDKDISSAGGTAEDVLKRVPSVSVDMDGNATLRNTAPEIFVDGKPTTLTMDQIPAEAIQSIEIITNPSSKYDASGGQAGILNIVLKKDKRVGYNGNIRAGIDQRGKVSGGGDINLREGKINGFLSANLNQRHSLIEGQTTRNNLIGSGMGGPLTNITQDQRSINDGLMMMFRGGLDFFMDNRNTFTLSGNYMHGRMKPTDDLTTTTDTVYPAYTHSTSYLRNSKSFRDFQNAGASLQYKHLFPKEGKELTGDMNYNKSQFGGGGDYRTNYFLDNGNSFGNTLVQSMTSSGYTEIYSGQMDYAHPINEKTKIETGAKASVRNFLSKSENYLKNDSTGDSVLITNQSANYKYNDQVYAAYVLFEKQLTKTSFQIGLRGESSFYTGELVDSNKTFKNYFPISLFPSGSMTYNINEKDNLQFSYSRRIKRPNFFQMIPFTDYSDSLNLKKGNADLKPEFTNSFELSYLKIINPKNNILITGYFKASTGLITTYLTHAYDTVLKKDVIISTYENANGSYVYGGELTSKHTLYKWLEVTLNGNAYYSILNAKNIESNLTNELFSWNAKTNVTVKLPKNITVQLNPEYRSKMSVPIGGGEGRGYGGGGMFGGPTATAQGYIQANFDMDVSVKYEFLKNKAASITLSVRDAFKTDANKTITESPYFNQTTSRIRDPQFFRLNFSYRFGKFDTSLFKRKNMKVNTDGMDMGM